MYCKNLIVIFLLLISISFACVKYQDYPHLEFKNEESYVFNSQSMSTNQPFKVGIIATKNNDPLRNVIVTVIYGNDSLRNTLYSNILTGDSVNRYMGDYSFTTLKQAGVEKYTFSIESSKGIISSRTITIRVE